MTTMTYDEADQKFDIEQYVQAPVEDDAEVHVFEDDAVIEGDFDISERGNTCFWVTCV